MADVVELNDLDDLVSVKLLWESLHAATPRASFFQTYDWLRLFWRHSPVDRKFRILVIRSGGTPIGIVPLCVETEAYQIGWVRVLSFPLADWGGWYAAIGPHQAASWQLAMRHLAATPRDWDLIDLRGVDAESSSRCRPVNAMEQAGMAGALTPYQIHSVVHLEGDWESYLASRSSKWRHEIRRQLRVVDDLGTVHLERHRPEAAAAGDGDPRWDLWETCLEISAKSWQAQSSTGNTLCDLEVRAFLAECHAAAARLGMLDLSVLSINQRPAAYFYAYRFHGRVSGLRMGYDAGVSRRGLGRALMASLIRDSFARGDTSIELGEGDFDFKRHFRTAAESNYRLRHFPWSDWRAIGVRFTKWLHEVRQEGGPTYHPTARETA